MASDVDAAIAGLKQDARRQIASMPKKKKRPPRLTEAEQIRRFLAGDEKARVLSGEITPAQYREYQDAMVERLRQLGALEE